MSTSLRLAAFALGLVAVFGAALGLGRLVDIGGPPAAGAAAAEHGGAHRDRGHGDGGHGTAPEPAADAPAGLQISEGGYTLALDSTSLPAGPAVPIAFRVLGPDQHTVTAFDESHGEDLHLIAVRRDLTGYQHVHPDLAADGTWRAALELTPGSWRVFTDFTASADGENRTLGADLAVPGEHVPEPLPAPSLQAEVDGYRVGLGGTLEAGEESELTLTVRRDGAPVTDLQPYLGAYGHLVVLRAGDLAYLHVHPVDSGVDGADGTAAPGPDVRFGTRTPSPGTYRLFFDFRHGDVVRTAAFTVEVGPHEEAHR